VWSQTETYINRPSIIRPQFIGKEGIFRGDFLKDDSIYKRLPIDNKLTIREAKLKSDTCHMRRSLNTEVTLLRFNYAYTSFSRVIVLAQVLHECAMKISCRARCCRRLCELFFSQYSETKSKILITRQSN